jgi:hypothetical protein
MRKINNFLSWLCKILFKLKLNFIRDLIIPIANNLEIEILFYDSGLR